jgi:hypothetical protein
LLALLFLLKGKEAKSSIEFDGQQTLGVNFLITNSHLVDFIYSMSSGVEVSASCYCIFSEGAIFFTEWLFLPNDLSSEK